MKILCVHQASDLYGSGRVFLRSIKALKKEYPNAQVTAKLPSDGPLVVELSKVADEVVIGEIQVLRRSSLTLRAILQFPKTVQDFLNCVRELKQFDLAYLNTIVLPNYILASRFAATDCYLHIHEMPARFESHVLSLLINFSKATLIFVSSACRETYGLLPTKQWKVLWNGTPDPGDCPALNQGSKTNYLLIGRFNSWKGQDLLLHALGKLDRKKLECVAVRLVGDVFEDQTFYLDQINSLVDSYGLQGVVEIHPFTVDPANHYSWAHVCIVPSTKPDPLPLVTIEAMSYGRCTIVAAHGGLLDMCVDMKTGRHFEPGNADELANYIVAYADDWSMIESHGSAARERYENEFRLESYEANFIGILDQS